MEKTYVIFKAENKELAAQLDQIKIKIQRGFWIQT